MSGGSYDYLCYKDEEDIGNYLGQLKEMRDRLIELGVQDFANDFTELIDRIKVNDILTRLHPIMNAVEWYDSSDIGLDRLRDVIKEQRKKRYDKVIERISRNTTF